MVADEEHLYRRIRDSVAGQVCFKVEGGRVLFFAAAFNDPNKQPSMDRARVRLDPQPTRMAVEDGIVRLHVEAIRRLGPIAEFNAKGKPTDKTYTVDVKADPRRGNCAHSLTGMNPDTAGGGSFKRLKDGLARLATDATWYVEPNAPLPEKPAAFRFGDVLRCLKLRVLGVL